MNSVFLLDHLHIHSSSMEDVKTIGIYSSYEKAVQAVRRLKSQPGFRDYPNLIDPNKGGEGSGFYIDEYKIDQDNWKDGFGV